MAEPLHCLVEIPKGSRNKYEWDEELGVRWREKRS